MCHGKWSYTIEKSLPFQQPSGGLKDKDHLYLTDGNAKVLADMNGIPQMTVNRFGKGMGVYMSDFRVTPQNTRMLLDILLYAANLTGKAPYITSDCRVETAYYPASSALIVINNAADMVETSVSLPNGNWLEVTLDPLETKEISL